jgi:micrococcal nuclease
VSLKRRLVHLAVISIAMWFLWRGEKAQKAPDSVVVMPPAAVDVDAGLALKNPAALPAAQVVRVVDGDTIHVRYDGSNERLRYYGVNTPEVDRACYEGATERNRVLSGTQVRLLFDGRGRDSYGRLLAYVYTDDGRLIDAALVQEGWGRAWKKDGRFRNELVALEKAARKNKTGCLWEKGGTR